MRKTPLPLMTGRRLAAFLAPALLSLFALPLAASSAHAESLVWATGHVIDANGRPVRGALVAVYDDGNKVVDYARTDRNGDYALAVPRKVFHLDRKRGKGFIAEVFTTVIRFAGDAAGFVANPARAGLHAVTSSEAANFTDPLTRGEIAAGGAVADRALSLFTPRSKRPPLNEERKQPGSLLMKVVAPNSSDLLDVGRVYWMQQEMFRAGGKERETLAAWLDPVQLMPSESEKPSKVESEYLRFSFARLEPSIAEPGESVRIVAKLLTPPEPEIYSVVVARNSRTGQMWELHAVGDGRYEGEIQVDRKFPKFDQTISLIAYPAHEDHPGRRGDAEHAIEAEGMWDVKKPYKYDPLLVVSRNRADITLTVISGEKRRR